MFHAWLGHSGAATAWFVSKDNAATGALHGSSANARGDKARDEPRLGMDIDSPSTSQRSTLAVVPLDSYYRKMSSLAGALDETLATIPKAEDVVHDLTLAAQLEDDVEMDVKPRSENGQDAEEPAPAQDEDMEDLFGEDDVADDVKHEESVSSSLRGLTLSY